ncbi:hypothetical protein NBT05_02670 [Aquimarina sp. ERC-38]|uniref:hypothetical protein n=1 Tax=Aquimarina sp. ERC-38 TaxID=2949996 RepID=UPI002247CBFB|nr:hypothetical protein [Aquimarina sp. ERC-38]UZO81385.1 hypothetical protein NBT05_02670 [Aquimarina sp. ERC-38]
MYIMFWLKHKYKKVDVFSGRPNTIGSLRPLFLGGRQPKDIGGIYTTKAEAQKVTEGIYRKFNIKR